MNNNVVAKIETSLIQMNAADTAMTQALEALEVGEYKASLGYAQEVLINSENIEQRLAALFLQNLAASRDQVFVDRTLKIAYDTDHRFDLIAKLNAACLKLEKMVTEIYGRLRDAVSRHHNIIKSK